MSNRKTIAAIIMAIIPVVLAGCNLPMNVQNTDPGEFYTQAASTIIAQMTYSVAETYIQQKTEEAKVTSTPTASATPEATNTPTQTPKPTATPTNTEIPIPCNGLQFVADITVDDGERMAPNEDFEKIWRIKNIGTCTWTTDYDLVFVDGDRMDGDKVVPLHNKVSPGNSIDVGVDLVAPDSKGTYTGYWMLRSSGGSYFGWGPGGENAFYVKIVVGKTSSSSSNDDVYDTPFYFADNMCLADWSNDDNGVSCSDTDTDEGFAYLDENPWLEKGGRDNEPAIVVHPQNIKNGIIEGKFPPISIQDGDHFYAAIGCMKNHENCDVDFTIKYRGDDGKLNTLGSWEEEYDGKVGSISLDLSSLKDQDVIFYLIVSAHGSPKDDTAFWLNPQIR
jgi:hypothetical protein